MTRGTPLALPAEPLPVQLQNKTDWNEHRNLKAADFYTLGYVRRTIDEIIKALSLAGVAMLVDIRQYPVSQYRPEFSKRNLKSRLARHQIGYLHVPVLGVPREVRALAFGREGRCRIWEWYDQHVVPEVAGRNLTWFCNALEHPAALMCMELDPTSCHRHRLALALERHGLCGYDL